MKNILFVCLGNICRSPMGEGMLKFLVEEKNVASNYYIDSAGTSAHHVGEKADHRMRKTASSHGVELTSRARQVIPEDFDQFDIVIAMDSSNYRNLQQLASNHNKRTDHIRLMCDFDYNTDITDVPDPYYGGDEGFENVYEIVKRSCTHLLDHLEEVSLT